MNTPPDVVDLASLEQVIDDAHRSFQGARPWWRGHVQADWELRAGVFRTATGKAPFDERALFSHFRDRATTRHTSCPDVLDHIGWLFLAQHYGLPTRLLDWSASPLMGLYFAVRDAEKSSGPGHLYALSPGRLNMATAGQNTERFSTLEPLVQQYALNALGAKEKVYSEQLPTAITVCTREIDARMLVQQSVFTLHRDGTELTSIKSDKPCVLKFTIPTAAKQTVKDRLAWLGVRDATVFPDLEHLAVELRRAEFHTFPV